MQLLHRRNRNGKPSESDPSVDEGQTQAGKFGSSAAPVFHSQISGTSSIRFLLKQRRQTVKTEEKSVLMAGQTGGPSSLTNIMCVTRL